MSRFLLIVTIVLFTSLPACRSDDAIVGTWTRRADSGEVVRYTFRSDGTVRIVAISPLGDARGYSASFSLSGDTLLTLSDDQGTEEIPLEIRGDTLVLFDHEAGMTSRLTRVHGDQRIE